LSEQEEITIEPKKPKFWKYLITYTLVVMICIGLLFLSGLLPQERVEKNYLLSLDELKTEYPIYHIIRYDWGSYQLDDWTEVIILSLSTAMDVKDNPISVMKNAYPLEDTFTLDSARASVENHEESDVFYVWYWHGFRVYVRAMLTLMDLGSIRTFLIWGYFLLMSAATLMLAFRTKSIWPPMLFTVGMLFVNPSVASMLFQYSICFNIAFIGMLFVPYWLKHPERAPMGFMILGMLTMFFDFYTTPLLTLGLPLLALLICQSYSKNPPKAKAMFFQALKLFLVWFAAYVGMWLTKLALTSIFTDQNAFALAWEDAAVRLGVVKDPELMFRYDKVATIISAFKHLFDWPMLYAFCGVLVTAGVTMIFLRTKREWYARGAVMLFVAFLPILWILVGTQPMFMHAHFQYRILAITMLGGMYFWLLAVDRKRLPEVTWLNEPEDKEN
jgi:hypothetical protein